LCEFRKKLLPAPLNAAGLAPWHGFDLGVRDRFSYVSTKVAMITTSSLNPIDAYATTPTNEGEAAGSPIAFASVARRKEDTSMLSLKRYRWLCVLGAEVAYFLCLFGDFLPIHTAGGVELHHRIFETLPGFVWLNVQSVILGAVYMFVFAWIFGSYFVWMHNTSLIKADTEAKISVAPRKTA